ncbi:MAG: glucose-6-phosphate isomerase family protein [Halanaerobiales bacterium]
MKKEFFEPINSFFNFSTLELEPSGNLIIRNLSDMFEMYQDSEKAKEILDDKDPVIYRFYNVKIPEEANHLRHCISMVFPGKIGKEYYMTKGHFHEIENTAEVYLTLRGKGMMVMQTPDNETDIKEMKRGVITYVPPYWAHRCVNTGNQPLVFFAIYRGDAGHNYGIIEEKGMKKLVMEEQGEVVIRDNPDY